MTDLEARFEQEMIEKVYRAAGREAGYWAGHFLRSVKKHGGLSTARRLLEQPQVSKGLLRLAELNRLDLAMEALVLEPTYRTLFTDGERAMASKRLEMAQNETGRAPG